MNLTLKRKVVGLTIFAALLPVLALSILTYVQKQKIHTAVSDGLDELIKENRKVVSEDLENLIRANTEGIAKDVYIMCESTNALIQSQVNHDLNVARTVTADQGGIEVNDTETVMWEAINQYTKKKVEKTLPQFTVKGTWLGQNRDLAVHTPVIDEVTDLVGGTCTIFQRMNEAGDMLRVATNVETLDGKRAIGTYIPAKMPPDDQSVVKDNAVVSTILQGETYRGLAFVVNAWYLTAYEPIRDAKGEIIGVLYVGVKRDGVVSVNEAIQNIKVGKTGNVFVVQGSGEDRGKCIISKDGLRNGQSVWDVADEAGEYPIRTAIKNSIEAPEGTCAVQTFRWKNEAAGETAPREVTTAVIYFEPWDWVISAASYNDDNDSMWQTLDTVLNGLSTSMRGKLNTALFHLQASSISMGLLLLVAMVIIAIAMGGRIAGPISKITNVAQTIARGDLETATQSLAELADSPADRGPTSEEGDARKFSRRDETGQLLEATGAMARNLSSLVGQVQKSGIQVTTSSTEIAASAKQLEAATTEQAASTNQVVATATEISATSHDLAETMEEATAVSSQTAELADTGRSDLEGMETTMRQLAEATRSIGSRLSAINEKANNISSVVTTINKVADQTNLLSLNAAIEAEKAGEYGQGFSVVAREIRRLADQSAVATLDIEQMVGEMQSAVSAGVMEMDKFNTEVRRSVEEMARISEQQTRVIEQVQALTPRFETVNAGMRTQSESAQQISESMVQLNEAAQQTAGSLREFSKIIEQLNTASHGLQQEVSRFKVSS